MVTGPESAVHEPVGSGLVQIATLLFEFDFLIIKGIGVMTIDFNFKKIIIIIFFQKTDSRGFLEILIVLGP